MTKNRLNKCISVLLCTLMIIAFASTAYVYADDATAKTEPLTFLNANADINISFWYDSAFPTVTIISPSGIRYAVAENTVGIQAIIESKYAAVHIPSAQAGQWYIEYTQGTNTEFEFSVMGSTENIWIQYVNVSQGSFDNIQVSFLAERGNASEQYSYTIYLTYEGENAEKVALESGNAFTGTEESRHIYLGNYNSYGEYKLILEVELQTPEVTLFDSLESETFAFTNSNTPSGPSGIDITVDICKRTITADWSNYTSYSYSGYRLIITGASGESIIGVDLDKDSNRISQYISEAYSSVTVTLYGVVNGILSDPLTKNVTLKGGVELVTSSPTASSQAQIKFDLLKDTLLNVIVNGQNTDFISDGNENTLAVSIKNGLNEISAAYTENGIKYLFAGEIYKDGTAPVIEFFEPYSDKTFPDSKAVLVGSVDDAVRFLVNGEEKTISNGRFTVTLELVDGANEFLFEAFDEVGNRTVHPITLYFKASSGLSGVISDTDKADMPWLPAVIGAVIAVAFIVFAVILCSQKKKLKAFSTVSIIVFCAFFAALSITGFIYNTVKRDNLNDIINSYEFSEIAGESLEQAHEILTEVSEIEGVITTHLILMIISLVCLAVSIVVHIVISLKSKKRMSKNEQTQKKENEQTQAQINETDIKQDIGEMTPEEIGTNDTNGKNEG